MDYWEFKIVYLLELAPYVLDVLAVLAANVLSQRAFGVAGRPGSTSYVAVDY